MIAAMLMLMVNGSLGILKKIFRVCPHMTWDNFFLGDEIMEHLGKLGFGCTMTCRRDRLPGGLDKTYFHHERNAVSKIKKGARFLQPIAAIKTVVASADEGGKLYSRVYVSFQSTGSTNISTVNALNSNNLSIVNKERGVGVNKRIWGIEMCDARYLYLQSYGRTDIKPGSTDLNVQLKRSSKNFSSSSSTRETRRTAKLLRNCYCQYC